eukprot:3933084-Rhodomonas_salina.1
MSDCKRTQIENPRRMAAAKQPEHRTLLEVHAPENSYRIRKDGQPSKALIVLADVLRWIGAVTGCQVEAIISVDERSSAGQKAKHRAIA